LRIAFDETFTDADQIKYGALNIGGLGPSKYHEFCVILSRHSAERYGALAFVKGDSLNYIKYEGSRHTVNIDELSKDVATKKTVHFLTAIKHREDISKVVPERWSTMICNDNDYIESQIKDEILYDHIDHVKISKKDYDNYFAELYRYFKGEASDEEKYRVADFRGVRKMLDVLKIKLEVLDESQH
jgi:hypothetical protein